jgi:hypothetical protein
VKPPRTEGEFNRGSQIPRLFAIASSNKPPAEAISVILLKKIIGYRN